MLINNTWLKLCAIGIIAYFIFKNYGNEIVATTSVVEKIAAAKPAPVPGSTTSSKDNTDIEDSLKNPACDDNIKAGYLERKLAGVIASFAETEQGKNFLEQMIKPSRQITTEIKNFEQYNGILDVRLEHQVPGTPLGCGSIVTIKNHHDNLIKDITLGNNEYVDGLDSVIAKMHPGEIMNITMVGNKKYLIETMKVKRQMPEFYKSPINFYGIIPGCGAEVAINYNIVSIDKQFQYDHYAKTNNLIKVKINDHLSPRLLSLLYDLQLNTTAVTYFNYAQLKEEFKHSPQIFENIILPHKDGFALEVKIISAEYKYPSL
ncbi:hypothetical protein [Rickettsiales endosymbiont of Stachyamoeba lipophora]|uniref:hypothetical protein n=1 Tax=Rickettsiales endosymbiont of Stachyamoeba lipophora TaxID=2486578 RepID=UPI000F64F993|nr:hypothetical protein [Rickettsiales endosymbiont of Stachyamoeba lipophora]AZL15570.1 hypothetical protein EF513_03260 [Rickettsiales endosymbiont of Stachyamoeba lipophora]